MSIERIYIVDDEITISKLLEMWVGQRWGYATEVFSDGKSFWTYRASRSCAHGPYAPDINGVDLLKKIKQHNPDIPVIVLSAQRSVSRITLFFGAVIILVNPPFPRKVIKFAQVASLSREVNTCAKQRTFAIRQYCFQSGECRKYSNLSTNETNRYRGSFW
jgi:DNA-binding NtrC family response regulator